MSAKRVVEILLVEAKLTSIPEKRLALSRNLLSAELIWPRAGIARKSAAREVKFRKGTVDFTAEEWITDEEAFNRKGTKMLPATGKFRMKTIDLMDELAKIGVNIVIYANQLLRAAYPAMKACAERILSCQRAQEASAELCMPIKEIISLI